MQCCSEKSFQDAQNAKLRNLMMPLQEAAAQ